MKKLLGLIVLLLMIAAFGVSLNLLRSVVGVASPWFGSVVMLDVTGLVAVARPVFLLPLPGFLRKTRAWEQDGKLYDALGVPAFGALLRNTLLRYLNPMVYLSRHPGDTKAVLAQIEAAEGAHYLAAAALVPWMVYAVVHGWFAATAAFVAVQIGFNAYPAMHLRSVRVRLSRFAERQRLKGR
jgi:hypothetical protein